MRHTAPQVLGAATAILLLMGGLEGCQKNTIELTPAELEHIRLLRNDPDHGRRVRATVTEFGSEEGIGEVVAVDPVGLTVSLRHRQESREDWPGMVMTFRLRRSRIPVVSPGERVYFRAIVQDGAGEILDLRRAPPP